MPSCFRQTSNKSVNIVVSLSLILYFITSLWNTISYFVYLKSPFNTFCYSEFLINFQGGFVRRGLLGEILYRIYLFIPFPIIITITVLSLIAFLFILSYFIYQFHKQKYCWWIIFSPLFLGMTFYFIRKDYLLYAILIGGLYILRSASDSINKRIFAFLLLSLGLFLHEAFIFFCFPIYALLLLSLKNHRYTNYTLIVLPIIIFLVLCKFKGSTDIAISITNSWNNVLPGSPLSYTANNSIGALGWESIDTFLFHLRTNASTGRFGIILIPLVILAAYYMFTNFFSLFNQHSDQNTNTSRLCISLLYSISILCLLPMFTVLSCDIGRVFQYSAVSTFAAFLILPNNMIIDIFPKWYKHYIERFNYNLNRFLPPSKGLLLVILFLFGMVPFGFSLQGCWNYSIVGELFTFLLLMKTCLVQLFL